MPTYEYQCTKCRHFFEEFQLISEPPLTKCPKCGGKPERIISGGAGFLFKGSGFYSTDYRSEGYRKAAEKDRPSPTESAPKNPTPSSSGDKK